MDQPKPGAAPPSGGAPAPMFDAKTLQTIQWSAIAGAVAGIVEHIAGYAAARMTARATLGRFGLSDYGFALPSITGPQLNLRGLLGAVITAAVIGAIGGWVLARFFPLFLQWNKQYLKGRLRTFFELLFFPTVVAGILLALLGLASASLTGFGPWLVLIIGLLVGRFLYAKIMDMQVGKHYPMS